MSPSQFIRRLYALLHRKRLDGDMDEEMAFHISMERSDAIRRGVPESEATAAAHIAFGSVQRAREEGREARGTLTLLDTLADLKYAVRVLRKAPVFATVAIVTLALGIGANSAIFSVVNAVMLRTLPFRAEAELVSVWDGGHSMAEFVAVRDRIPALQSTAAFRPGWEATIGASSGVERVIGAVASPNLFSTLGVNPYIGRFFTEGDDAPGQEPIVVLSYGLWSSRYGSDAGIVGQTIDVDGVLRRVVGVAPRALSFPTTDTRLWIPLTINASAVGEYWGSYGQQIVGRLATGASPEIVRQQVSQLALELLNENPVWKPDSSFARGITVTPLREYSVKQSRQMLLVLLGAVALVLLLTCTNVANLQIVRGASRESELAVRATLGAGIGRIRRQLISESLVIAVAGGTLGLALGAGLVRVLIRVLPPETPRLAEASLDPRVVGFTVAVTLLTGLAFGLLPARRSSRHAVAAVARGNRATSGPAHRRAASTLVGAQIAVALLLTVSAGLVVRSLGKLLAVDVGFEQAGVVTARISPPRAAYSTPEAQRRAANSITESLRGVRELQVSAITSHLPFDQRFGSIAVFVDGWTRDPNKLESFDVRRVSPEFFQALGIPLRAGRTFNRTDDANGPPVAVVSQSAVDAFFQGRDVLSGRVRFPWPGWMSVVGVVGDVRSNDLRSPALPTLYLPIEQAPEADLTIVGRTSGDPATAMLAIRNAAQEALPDVAVSDLLPMTEVIERSLSATRATATLLLGFGVLAILLGAIGTYGLIAYNVACRRKEFAVRLALGAQRVSVLGLVLGEGVRLAIVGVAAGLVAALFLTRLLRSLLFDVSPADPVAMIGAALLLLTVAAVASTVPAWRATRVDANKSLRE